MAQSLLRHTLEGMTGFRAWGLALGVLTVVLYAAGSGYWVSSSGDWYAGLNRPAWQPPDFVFGLIWPYNFVMLGVAAYVVSQRLERSLVVAWLLFLAISVIAALVWAQQFYVPHNLVVAAAALTAAALFTIPVVAIAWRASAVVGALLLPYQVWVLLATALSIAYARMNA